MQRLDFLARVSQRDSLDSVERAKAVTPVYFSPASAFIDFELLVVSSELLATNKLDDIGMATPAISEGVLYFRTGKSLIALGR